MSVKETLVKAREILIERGVNRDGHYVNQQNGCQVCALGAVRLASGGEITGASTVTGFHISAPYGDDYYDAQSALEDFVYANTDDFSDWDDVPSFNDFTKEDAEVIGLFDKVIAGLEES